jgi:hypothetical protein
VFDIGRNPMDLLKKTKEITKIIIGAERKAKQETAAEPTPGTIRKPKWPISCTIGPGLEGAIACETKVVETLGKEKRIFPNVDLYSGIVCHTMGVPTNFFTPLFAVSRVAGWTSRILEYLKNNRIFRPRALYVGPFNKTVEENRRENDRQ